MLGIKPDIFSFTSDHFERILHHAEELIYKGLAYVDNTPQEEMMKEREERKPSRNRDNWGRGVWGEEGKGEELATTKQGRSGNGCLKVVLGGGE